MTNTNLFSKPSPPQKSKSTSFLLKFGGGGSAHNLSFSHQHACINSNESWKEAPTPTTTSVDTFSKDAGNILVAVR